jgi:uncharacterized SAM-dependent methyltransferase
LKLLRMSTTLTEGGSRHASRNLSPVFFFFDCEGKNLFLQVCTITGAPASAADG